MPKYAFAGFCVDIEARHEWLYRCCEPYLDTTGRAPDFTLRVTEADLARERAYGTGGTPAEIEFVATYRRLVEQLPVYDAMMLHAAVAAVNRHGVAFVAPSGVGKTTQLRLWKQQWGDRLTVVNGDKPIVRLLNGIPYAYGTPWSGKEGWNTPMCVPLTDLCFVERAEVDRIQPMSTHEALGGLIKQIVPPQTVACAEKTLELLDVLLRHCRLWRLCCTMSPSAAQVASAAIMGDDEI